MGIRVGLQIHPQHAQFPSIRRAWVEADELGVDTITTWDHFYPLYGERDGEHFECWTMLGAMAEATKRAQIGALVSCNSYRNPNLLADMARTVDHISGGRLILGIGAGWFERDYVEFGYEFGTKRSRTLALERDLPIVKDRLARGNPAPVNGRIPVFIAGSGRQIMLRLVAEHADMWHSFGTVEEWGEKNEALNEWCRKVGRDPAEIERSTSIRDTADIASAADYAAAGAQHMIVGANGPSYDLGPLRELLAWRGSRPS